jgi:hypothetical protein
VAARAKKMNRSKRIDGVPASRDGHQFHEARVARRFPEAIHGAFKVTRRGSVRMVAEWVRAPMYVPPLHNLCGLRSRLRQR